MKAIVIYTDREYKEHKKVFTTNPKGCPENETIRAKRCIAKLEKDNNKSQYGLYRNIRLELI